MRRIGHHKFIRLSIFFLVYSIIHIVTVRSDRKDDTKSSASQTPVPNKHVSSKSSKIDSALTSSHHSIPKDLDEFFSDKTNSSKLEHGIVLGAATVKDAEKHLSSNLSKIDSALTSSHNSISKDLDDFFSDKTNSSKLEHGVVLGAATIRKAEVTIEAQSGVNVTDECTPAAIRQFPRPLMPPYVRRHGGLIIHTIVAIYMFIGLAIVCDEYFVASLDRICEELKMSPDVAGATFMAAGSSAPELATVIIGVFYADDDIGISGVIGSAVFNIMFVISVCALATGTVVYLNWWPLIRDSFFYAISILIMLAVIGDKNVNWFESVVMMATYGIYCIVLHFNPTLEKWAQTLPVPFKLKAPTEQSGLVSYKNLEDDTKHTNYGIEWNEGNEQQQQPQEQLQWSPGRDWSPEKRDGQQNFQDQLSGPSLNQATTDVHPPQPPVSGLIKQDYYKPKEYDPSTKVNPLLKPAEEAGKWAKFKWAVLYPIHFFCLYTMPDCRSEKYRNWYPFTFFVSMLWISFYSFFMVWMITIIGYTLGIPDTVMGLTFVAAGVSVPDALSSIAVIKEGYGDMAVSNAIGSNVFDILMCLGLPWFISTAIVHPGDHVKVISKAEVNERKLL